MGDAGPVVAEAAVVLDAEAQKTRVHVGVEDGRAVGRELGDGALGAPVDQDIAVGQDLCGALGFGEQVVGRVESLDDFGLPGVGVDLDDLAAGDVVKVHLVAVTILGAVGRVVVQADDLLTAVLRLCEEAGVMLKGKLNLWPQGEVGRLATELPDDIARSAVNLVHGVGVSGRDQVVPVGVLVDRVDVEVVPGVRAVVAGAGLAGIQVKVTFY